jgi:hypothetical protein
MKQTTQLVTRLLAVLLLTLLAATTASAAALNARLVLRPVTPGDISNTNNALASTTETSPGLNTLGIGSPAYLEAQVDIAISPADITNVTFVLTSKPVLSEAIVTNSPLGMNIPVYGPGDRELYQVAGRALLRPDDEGRYTVVATIMTSSSGSQSVTNTLTAATYMGVGVCKLCHSGGAGALDKYTPWTNTAHAHIFTEGINGELGFYQERCIACHTVGYDPNTNAIVNPVNGGFDDVAKQLGWTFPSVLAPTNWAYMQAEYPALANLANIQCENCHGPGSQHYYSIGNTSMISKTLASGDCNQCHDAPTHHFKAAEWYNSRHSVAVEETGSSCGRCHTAQGFVNFAAGAPAVSTPYEVITCAACHEPHDATNPHQLRTEADVTLMDTSRPGGATVVTNGGMGKLCMQCHISRRDAVTYAESYHDHYGPHHGPQTDMFVGANAITYGQEIPSSAHRDAVEDACVTCHMQENEGTPSFTHAGGHTFNMKWDSGTNVYEMTEACVECHGEVEGFDFKRQDYDGNGVVEGVQTEVKGLLSKLALMLPPVGVPKPDHSPDNLAVDASWTQPQLKAAYNYLFVVEDGSYGVHNLSYAVGLLKASIADLTGDANNDGLPDTWQIQYFGSITNPDAAPNATPANDGVPNWLKYSLELDPTVPGLVIPGGVVWANGKTVGGGTNTIQIYTAAEVAFDTEQGKTYQIQSVSSLSSGWQNVGDPIPGTGNAISYVTPTRQNVQQFYRVYSY